MGGSGIHQPGDFFALARGQQDVERAAVVKAVGRGCHGRSREGLLQVIRAPGQSDLDLGHAGFVAVSTNKGLGGGTGVGWWRRQLTNPPSLGRKRSTMPCSFDRPLISYFLVKGDKRSGRDQGEPGPVVCGLFSGLGDPDWCSSIPKQPPSAPACTGSEPWLQSRLPALKNLRSLSPR